MTLRRLFLAGAVLWEAIAIVHANGTGSFRPPSGQQPADRGRPAGKLPFPHGGVHLRREAALQAPTIQEPVRLGKEAGVQAGKISRAERGRFLDLRAVDRAPDQVGESLHRPIRPGHAAVDPQGFQRALCLRPVRLHGGEKIRGLEADALERGLRELARPGRPRQAKQGAADIRPPVGRAQADEGRNEDYLLRRVRCRGERPGFFGALHGVQAVTQPFTDAPAMKIEPSSA